MSRAKHRKKAKPNRRQKKKSVGGRPPSEFTAVLPRARCRPGELKAYQRAADAEERSLSAWIRFHLNQAVDHG